MKKLVLVCLALLLVGGISAAEKPQQKQVKTTVFAADIDCDHCAKKILDNVPSLGKGVKDVQVDVAKKEVTVTYEAAKNSDEQIIKGLSSLKVAAKVKSDCTKSCDKKAACGDKKCCGDKKSCGEKHEGCCKAGEKSACGDHAGACCKAGEKSTCGEKSGCKGNCGSKK